MTADQLTAEQKLGSEIFFGDHRGWGFGMSVFSRGDDLCHTPGRFGWDGGYGTSWYSDPREQLTGILLTQRMMDSPQPPVLTHFWTSVYQAIDD
jgi:CubicO group peptidase (beta-lactamase class C family)